MPGLLPARERALWAAAWLVVAALVVATGFASEDPDSALYAGISGRLAEQPVTRWIAPEWWGFWPEARMTGLFREHPAGVFLLPAALGRVGIPPEQGAYVVGVAAGLGSLILVAGLIGRITSRRDGRAALVLLQFMPVAFLFRIRANHEYPMLFCLLLTLVGLDRLRRSSWAWAAVVAAGLTGALLVKGVFVVIVLAAAGLWVLTNPTQASGPVARPAVAVLVGLAAMAATAVAYDAHYLAVTGETFWLPYWRRQLGPLDVATPVSGAATLAGNLLFYLSRLVWHPAPWSVALLAGLWARRRDLGRWWRGADAASRRGLLFALGFAVLTVLALSPSSRFAERYAFSATFVVGAAGSVVALRVWPVVARLVERAERAVPALPVVVWLALMISRLAFGPFLPRV